MLELRNIVKVYQGGTVNETCLFNDFSLSIPDKQFVCVVGSNGSGKTSLLNIICGSIPIDEGKIMIGNEDITHMPEHKRHRRIGRVYQDPSRGTCPSMTILENMSMADNKGKPFILLPCVNRKKTEEYRSMLAQLGLGLEDKMGVRSGEGGYRYFYDQSGGVGAGGDSGIDADDGIPERCDYRYRSGHYRFGGFRDSIFTRWNFTAGFPGGFDRCDGDAGG